MSSLFSDFHLNDKLLKSIDDTGFTHCTPIQEQALSYTLQGNDLFAQSQTGTGKTAAFLISIFEIIQRSEYREQALVLVPTRELAVQIETEAKLLSIHLGYSILSVFGGVGYEQQERVLRSSVDLVVGTPGRIIDLSNKGTLKLKDFTIGVIDEADRMFDMGFVADIKKIIGRMPHKQVRQTMLFSATLDFSVKRLAEEYMYNPAEITIAPETKTVTNIEQILYHVGTSDKVKLLLGMIEKYNAPRMIVFSNTKRMCEELAGRLKYNGIDADFLTGDLPQKKRQQIIDRFKKHELPVLVATDVAARGIHIDDLELVINYDIPQHSENYVHRIGRTARAGKSGTALTFACEIFVEYLEPVEEYVKMKIPSTVACDEDFGADASDGKNWRKHKPGNPKPKAQEKRRQEQKNRNNYNLKKQHKAEEHSHHKTAKKEHPQNEAAPKRKIFSESKRKVYIGNPVEERQTRNSEQRLKLNDQDKSKEFDSPSRNPYEKRSKAKGSGNGKGKNKGKPNRNTESPKTANGNSKKNKAAQAGSKGKNTNKNTPIAQKKKPENKKGFTDRLKSLFTS